MNVSHLKRWQSAAWAFRIDQNPLRLPYEVALREALRAALFFKKFWKPRKKLPGLSNLSELSLSLADDLVSIVRAVQEAQIEMFLEEEDAYPLPPELDLWERGKEVRAELDAALSYLLKIGPPTEEDGLRIEEIKARWAKETYKTDSLQLFLGVFAETAELVRPALSELQDTFDVALIDEARTLVEKLDKDVLEQGEAASRQEKSRLLFYQLLALMQDRVLQMRKAVAFVFRNHPRVIQLFTSAYERRRRATSRKQKKK